MGSVHIDVRLAFRPGTTDAREFLGTPAQLGYDGPVRAEPLNRKLNGMDEDEASETTVAAMGEALSLVGYPSHRERTACSG